MAHPSELRIGIVGTGGRGSSLGRQFNTHHRVTVTALCDTNDVRCQVVAGQLGGSPKRYRALTDMLANDPLDAVVITSPDHCHEEHALAALGSGLHVLIDKPLATSAAACRRIIDAGIRGDRIVKMGFNLRHNSTLRRLKEIVDKGVLGELFLIENREFYNGGKTYMARWNRLRDRSGGLWIHKGAHDFDIFNWLLGHPRPVRVSATAGVSALRAEKLPFVPDPGVPPGPGCGDCPYLDQCPDGDYWSEKASPMWDERARAADGYRRDLCIYMSDKDVHDNGIAIVEYENGARASHLECFVTSRTTRLYTIVGTQGQAEVDLEERTILVRPRWSRETIEHRIPATTGGHSGADPHMVDTFIRRLRGEDDDQEATLEHGLWATAIGEAAELSVREQRMVAIDELFGDPPQALP